MEFKKGDRVNMDLQNFGMGTIEGNFLNNANMYVVNFDIGITLTCSDKLLQLVKLAEPEQTEYQKEIEYIMSHATNEELDKFCGLTEKDYDEFRKHHLEQTIADVSDKTLKKFMKEIE